jgi:hypothetical protein
VQEGVRRKAFGKPEPIRIEDSLRQESIAQEGIRRKAFGKPDLDRSEHRPAASV